MKTIILGLIAMLWGPQLHGQPIAAEEGVPDPDVTYRAVLAQHVYRWLPQEGDTNKVLALGLACPHCWDDMRGIAEGRKMPAAVVLPAFDQHAANPTKVLVAFVLGYPKEERGRMFQAALRVFVADPEAYLADPSTFLDRLRGLDAAERVTDETLAAANKYVQMQTEMVKALRQAWTPNEISLSNRPLE